MVQGMGRVSCGQRYVKHYLWSIISENLLVVHGMYRVPSGPNYVKGFYSF